jgi:small ligand-binding sensory domain FIST
MRWASTLSTLADPFRALAMASDSLRDDLEGQAPGLLLLFVSPVHRALHEALVAALAGRWPEAVLVGCEASSVIGGGQECEYAPGIVLVGAILPGVEVRAFKLAEAQTGRAAPADVEAIRGAVGCDPLVRPALVLLADPGTVDPALLGAFDRAYPGAPKVGGYASGAPQGAPHHLFAGGGLQRGGLVGLAMWGDLQMDTLVAQGCRPVGEPCKVTRALGSTVLALDGEPALTRLQGIFEQLDANSRRLFRSAPMLGVAIDTASGRLRRGDFLVRQVVGFDREQGALSVAHLMEVGDVVQLHVRDAATSAEDLRELLQRHVRAGVVDSVRGALQFTCLGRGEGLYGDGSHDLGLLVEQLGPIAVGGFFCNGEIGQVRGRSFLHGYTTVLALFRQREWS